MSSHDSLTQPLDTAQLRMLAQTLLAGTASPSARSGTNTEASSRSGEERLSAAAIVEFALERFRLGRTSDGLLVAIPLSHREAPVAREIPTIRGELNRAFRRERGQIISRTTMDAAIEALKAEAEVAQYVRVSLRASQAQASLALDLGDVQGRWVEVSAFGWEVRDPLEENDPTAFRPVFRRSAATMPLAIPQPGGHRESLRQILGIPEGDSRWPLLWGWLVASIFEEVPRPLLWALGQQGSGKSTRARMLLSLIDPAERLGREPGRNERDDSTSARSRFLPSWDNIGTVSNATSDWLCRLVTGVQVDRRALYTDDDVRTSTLMRTGVATSIVLPTGLGADALERLVLVEFDRIHETDRRPENVLWREFHQALPALLGCLLSDAAGVLAHLGEVRSGRHKLPRMADYAQILMALDKHTGDCLGFAEAYTNSVQRVLSDRAELDPLTDALIKVLKTRRGNWRGTPTALSRALEPYRPDDLRIGWPTERGISTALKKNAETLHAVGIQVEFGKSNGERWIHVWSPSDHADDAS